MLTCIGILAYGFHMLARKPSRQTLLRLYTYWLQGRSLRWIAQNYPRKVSHGTIAEWFRKEFGPSATDPKAMSLQRSLLGDYPNDPAVLEAVIGLLEYRADSHHRSKHSLKQLSLYQTIHDPDLMPYLAPCTEDPWVELERPRLDFLRLPMFTCLADVLVESLGDLANGPQS